MPENLLEGTFNFRDLGGYKTSDGKTVKNGLVYRSDALSKLSDQDLATLKAIGLKTIVDFRQEQEILKDANVSIPETKSYHLSPHAPLAQLSTGNLIDDKLKIDKLLALSKDEAAWAKMMEKGDAMALQMKEMAFDDYSLGKFREVFELLMNPASLPLVFHCKGGKDRTGLMAMLFLLALGVSKDDIIADYMLTKDCMAARNERRMNEYRSYTDDPKVLDYLASLMATKRSYIEIVFASIEKDYDSYEAYLHQALKLSSADIMKLKEIYL